MLALRGPVLAAINLTNTADEVLRQASTLAGDLRERLVVCHILPEMLRVRTLFPQFEAVDPTMEAACEERARDAIMARVEPVTGRTSAEYEVALDAGSPHAGILAVAEHSQAGLIVVGSGPVAERVARYASVPVLVARVSARGSVLGATDFSDPSVPAIEAAVSEASRRRTTLRVIHCLDVKLETVLNSEAMGGLAPVPEAVLKELSEGARRRLRTTLEVSQAAGEVLVAQGPPALSILESATRVATELVVVGSRGRTGLSRILLGSVAEAVVSAAPCSVLIVRLHSE